jgi:quercetin dioxygenase-like cupin family protein
MIDQSAHMRDIFAHVFTMIEAEIDTTPAARPMVDAAARHVASLADLATVRTPHRLPVCDLIPQALRASAMADMFETLAPTLDWHLRAGAADQGESFLRGHANALIFGHRDVSVPEKLTLGVSLMAPGVTYPDHAHPPEELYIVLSSGKWRQNRGRWVQRGPGALVHNPPGINHGMQADDSPLLALWLLLT